jgi:hypothetical protein
MTRAAVAASAAAILGVTLFPSQGSGGSGWDGCLVCGERGVADALANVILFIPLGAALALLPLRTTRIVTVAFLLSAAVETAQLVVPGRDPSPPDVLFNTLGALAGATLAKHRRAILLPSARAALPCVAAAAVAVPVAVAATGALLAPRVPPGQCVVRWTPVRNHTVYLGRVMDAALGSAPLRPSLAMACATVLRGMEEGGPLRVRLVAGPPGTFAPLLRVVAQPGREVLLLAASGEDLWVGWRSGATALRLDRPMLRLSGALRGRTPGATVLLGLHGGGGQVSLRVNGAATATAELPAGRGWSLLFFSAAFPPAAERALDALWLAALALPLGLWLRVGRRAGPALLLVLGGTAFAAAATGLVLPGPYEAAAVAAGVLAGAALQRVARAAWRE